MLLPLPLHFGTTGLLLGVATLLLSGCSVLPFQAQGNDPRNYESVEQAPGAPLETVVNDLSTGSVLHSLVTGDAILSVAYWSTLLMDKWTADASKPLTFSALAALGTDEGQSVYLARVTVVTAVDGPLGSLSAPPAFIDSASVSPGYLFKAPYSYSQTLIIPAVDPAATSVTLSITYELLIQASPGSTDFVKQTANDQIVVALTT